MNRRTARTIHQTTNLAFWLENPKWNPDVPILKLECKAMRALPFSLHKALKRAFFDTERLIAVNGETVVATHGTDKVDKFMFRYPGKMDVETFRRHVAYEVGAVTSSLVGIALPTEIAIKQADIFKRGRTVPAVTQTQQRLDLAVHGAIDWPRLAEETASPRLDRTARDLESMLHGTESLASNHGLYPDVTYSSGNLRRSILDGAVTLIDVMAIHADGTRLIGDNPPDLLEHTMDNIQKYQAFVGQYGG
jgi:hypothetical protein